METEKYYGTFYDAETGETVHRELTEDETTALLKMREEIQNVLAC